ncbi:MAG: F0F1 ATP synthase subunit B [bacterium]|nr:F0F1 ATP synthase subunit B [bacterium]
MNAIDLVTPKIGMWFWTTLLFLALLFILRKTAWNVILKALEEREKNIANDIEQAKQARIQAEKIREEMIEQQTKQLAQANEQIALMLKNATDRAQEIEEKAKQTAQKIQEQSKYEIELERQKAIASIRNEVANIAMLAAKTIIEREIKPEDHNKIIQDTLNRMN